MIKAIGVFVPVDPFACNIAEKMAHSMGSENHWQSLEEELSERNSWTES